MTTGEQAAALANQMLDLVTQSDASANAAVKFARRIGVTRKLAASFPPLDDEQAWQELVELYAGVLLCLLPDDELVDVNQALERGRAAIAALMDDGAG